MVGALLRLVLYGGCGALFAIVGLLFVFVDVWFPGGGCTLGVLVVACSCVLAVFCVGGLMLGWVFWCLVFVFIWFGF